MITNTSVPVKLKTENGTAEKGRKRQEGQTPPGEGGVSEEGGLFEEGRIPGEDWVPGEGRLTGQGQILKEGRVRKESRIFFLRTEMDRLLSLSILFSCLLVTARMIHTGRITFLFLVWNLFLAYIPYLITGALARRPGWVSNKLLFIPVFIVWLLFIPNSFYIITDLFHLGDRYNDRQAPQWFDLAMILSFVWNGLLLGVLSVRQMEHILLPKLSLRNELFFLYPIMWLNALGVYTGRYLRYNSWDVLTNPFQLLGDIASILLHPLRHQVAWDMILCFSILMTFMYLMMKKIHKALV